MGNALEGLHDELDSQEAQHGEGEEHVLRARSQGPRDGIPREVGRDVLRVRGGGPTEVDATQGGAWGARANRRGGGQSRLTEAELGHRTRQEEAMLHVICRDLLPGTYKLPRRQDPEQGQNCKKEGHTVARTTRSDRLCGGEDVHGCGPVGRLGDGGSTGNNARATRWQPHQFAQEKSNQR